MSELNRLRRRVVLEVEQAWSELRAASAQLAALRPELGPEAEAYGLMTTPLVVVDEEVVGAGRIVPAAKLVPILEKKLEAP